MTRRRDPRPPRSFAIDTDPARWLDAPMPDDVPRHATVTAEIARRVRTALAGTTQEVLADEAGIAPSTISKLTRGEHWPGVQTIARLETAASNALWPHCPVQG
ncbi:MAG: helix-turn-helix domain-containing protein, partial [Iamia sp.]